MTIMRAILETRECAFAAAEIEATPASSRVERAIASHVSL